MSESLNVRPRHVSVGHLFAGQSVYRVPKYQRDFAWDEEQMVDFWDDVELCLQVRLEGSRRDHFFGSILSVDKQIPGTQWLECSLVDGQQRMCSFVILASCMTQIYKELASDSTAGAAIQDICRESTERLANEYLEAAVEANRARLSLPRLELSDADRDYFANRIRGLVVSSRRKSHSRIDTAFRFIGTRIRALIKRQADANSRLGVLRELETVLDEDCTVVQLATDREPVAYRLFRSLNDRGTSLSDGDLLRVGTLELLEGYPDQQRSAVTIWDDILSDDRSVTSDLLKWYFASMTGRWPNKKVLFDEFMDEFFKEHRQTARSPQDADSILQRLVALRDEVAIGRALLEGLWPYDEEHTAQWDRERLTVLVKHLKHTHCIPLLLAAHRLGPSKFALVVQALERVFFRYKMICNLHITKMSNYYVQQATLIRHDPSHYRLAGLNAGLATLQAEATDVLFAAGLDGLRYQLKGGNKAIRYLLISLEHYWPWYKDGAQGRPECRNKMVVFDFLNTSIEHIYPENSSPSDRNLDLVKHTIGNLTFLAPSENVALGNKPWSQRQRILRRSAVLMNQEIAEHDTWDSGAVKDRSRNLREMAMRIFHA